MDGFRLPGRSALAAQADDLAIGAVSVVRLTLTGNQNISGMVPTIASQVVWLENKLDAQAKAHPKEPTGVFIM